MAAKKKAPKGRVYADSPQNRNFKGAGGKYTIE